MSPSSTSRSGSMRARGGTLALIAVGLVAMLYVAVINRGPLYYYDSMGYLTVGEQLFSLAGIGEATVGPAEAAAGTTDARPDDGVINISRSMVYAITATAFAKLMGSWSVVAVNVALVWCSVWLLLSALARALGQPDRASLFFAAGLGAAGLTSLPFYTGLFMPDILASVLILNVATISVFGSSLTRGKLVLACFLGTAAVLSHPSHLLMVAILWPFALLAAALAPGRHVLVTLVTVSLMLGVGLAEKYAVSQVARKAYSAKAMHHPFLTARLIEDRVGMDFLGSVCPTEAWSSCELYDFLVAHPEPERRKEAHITFNEDERGSFRLLHPEIQARIAREQVDFAIQTFLYAPFGTMLSVIRNTADQMTMNSIRMTLANRDIYYWLDVRHGVEDTDRVDTKLLAGQRWIRPVELLHSAVYVITALGAVAVFFWPGLLDGRVRLVVLVILAGIIANAVVCGVVSQPADRYGARVSWLWPFMFAIMAVAAVGRRRPG